VLRELVDIITKPLLIAFKRLWWLEEVPDDWKRANVTSVPKKDHPGDYRPLNLTWKARGANPPGSHFQTHQVYQSVWD